jgi:hypothetical protein
MTPEEVTKPEAEAGDEDDTDDSLVDLMVLEWTKSKEMEEPVNSKPMVELERRVLDVEPRLPSVARSGTHWAQVYEKRGELAGGVQLSLHSSGRMQLLTSQGCRPPSSVKSNLASNSTGE